MLKTGRNKPRLQEREREAESMNGSGHIVDLGGALHRA